MSVNFFNLKEAFAKGGFFNDGNYRIEEARFCMFDYNGTVPETTSFRLVLAPVVKKGNAWVKVAGENPATQYWSVSKPAFFVPNESGTGLEAVGDKETLSESCNFFLLMTSLQEAGFPMENYDNDCSVMEGSVMFFASKPAPERSGFQSSVAPGKEQKEGQKKTIILVTNVEVVGGGAPEPAKGKVAAGKGKPAPAKEPEPDPAEEGTGDGGSGTLELKDLLEAEVCTSGNTKGINIAQARMAILKSVRQLTTNADEIKAIIAEFNDKAKLAKNLKALGWKVDGDTIKK